MLDKKSMVKVSEDVCSDADAIYNFTLKHPGSDFYYERGRVCVGLINVSKKFWGVVVIIDKGAGVEPKVYAKTNMIFIVAFKFFKDVILKKFKDFK